MDVDPVANDDDSIRVVNEDTDLLIVRIPDSIASTIDIKVPPIGREEVAIKPSFEVASIQTALKRVESHGGVATDRAFRNSTFEFLDILDVEGNVVQIRCCVA